ncbi:hypothetical protein E5Q_03114 [Mixia osmundae IAM 14324]|uniref:MIF4G domain-containing protein n=1 Tax=Mixia osmundae (strain CBS 9802 / IAM 14324 / JCM 22182 / KY 12970) TaxID=764103 RepID=G7E0T6_MIXOS|nr:hypothetical protein E5Q_03114 [Mixia osmundae IAM 14324]
MADIRSLTPLLDCPRAARLPAHVQLLDRTDVLPNLGERWDAEALVFPAAWPRARVLPYALARRSSTPTLQDITQVQTDAVYCTPENKVLWQDTEQLLIAVNRYYRARPTRRQSKAPRMTIVTLHASASHKETYEPMFAHLLEALGPEADEIEELWSIDHAHQGVSGLLNPQNSCEVHTWSDDGRDLLNFLLLYLPPVASPDEDDEARSPMHDGVSIRLLSRQTIDDASMLKLDGSIPRPVGLVRGRKIVGLGHSIGADGVIMAATGLPCIFSAVVAIDPVIGVPSFFTDEAYPAMRKGWDRNVSRALARKDRWASREAAAQSLARNKAFFGRWTDEIFDLFMQFGITEDDQGARLTSTKVSEAAIFCQPGTASIGTREIFSRMTHIPVSLRFHYVLPAPGSCVVPERGIHEVLAALPQHVQVTRIDDAAHLMVQEHPRSVATVLARLLRLASTPLSRLNCQGQSESIGQGLPVLCAIKTNSQRESRTSFCRTELVRLLVCTVGRAYCLSLPSSQDTAAKESSGPLLTAPSSHSAPFPACEGVRLSHCAALQSVASLTTLSWSCFARQRRQSASAEIARASRKAIAQSRRMSKAVDTGSASTNVSAPSSNNANEAVTNGPTAAKLPNGAPKPAFNYAAAAAKSANNSRSTSQAASALPSPSISRGGSLGGPGGLPAQRNGIPPANAVAADAAPDSASKPTAGANPGKTDAPVKPVAVPASSAMQFGTIAPAPAANGNRAPSLASSATPSSQGAPLAPAPKPAVSAAAFSFDSLFQQGSSSNEPEPGTPILPVASPPMPSQPESRRSASTYDPSTSSRPQSTISHASNTSISSFGAPRLSADVPVFSPSGPGMMQGHAHSASFSAGMPKGSPFQPGTPSGYPQPGPGHLAQRSMSSSAGPGGRQTMNVPRYPQTSPRQGHAPMGSQQYSFAPGQPYPGMQQMYYPYNPAYQTLPSNFQRSMPPSSTPGPSPLPGAQNWQQSQGSPATPSPVVNRPSAPPTPSTPQPLSARVAEFKPRPSAAIRIVNPNTKQEVKLERPASIARAPSELAQSTVSSPTPAVASPDPVAKPATPVSEDKERIAAEFKARAAEKQAEAEAKARAKADEEAKQAEELKAVEAKKAAELKEAEEAEEAKAAAEAKAKEEAEAKEAAEKRAHEAKVAEEAAAAKAKADAEAAEADLKTKQEAATAAAASASPPAADSATTTTSAQEASTEEAAKTTYVAPRTDSSADKSADVSVDSVKTDAPETTATSGLEPGEVDESAAFLKSIAEASRIQSLSDIDYPEGVKPPRDGLNAGSKPGKFRYDRDYLLQFLAICTQKPAGLPELDAIGMTDVGPSRSGGFDNKKGMGPPPGRGGANSSMGRNAGGFQMGNFSGSGGSKGMGVGGAFGQGFGMGARSGSGMARAPSQSGMMPAGYVGREGRRSQRGKPRAGDRAQTSFVPEHNVAPLEKSENRWMRMKPGTSTDETSPEIVQRKVKALLNKLTVEKFVSISDQVLAWANKSAAESDGRILRQVIALIFEKATDEAAWSEMYARLCRKIQDELSPEVVDLTIERKDGQAPVSGGSLFRKYLLTRCQQDYEKGWASADAAAAAAQAKAGDDSAKQAAIDKAAAEAAAGGKVKEDQEIVLLSDEYYAAQKAKRRGLGLVRFIGELYKLQMLTSRIMHQCLHKLLLNVETPEEEDVESLCRLLTTIGAQLEADSIAVNAAKAASIWNAYLDRVALIADNDKLSSRIRFMAQDVLDLKKDNWRPRHNTGGPKTLSEVHEDAARQAEEARRAAQSSSGKGLPRMQDQLGRGGSRGGRSRDASGQEGWQTPSAARPAPAGSLHGFGKVRQSTGSLGAPSSVFANKSKGAPKEDKPDQRANAFAVLSQSEPSAAPVTGSRATSSGPERKKLALAPRTKALEEDESQGVPDTPAVDAEPEAASEAVSDEPSESVLRSIKNGVTEFFTVKDVSEGVQSMQLVEERFRHIFMSSLLSAGLEKKQSDVDILCELVEQLAEEADINIDWQRSFAGPIIGLPDVMVDAPKAATHMANLLAAAGLSEDDVKALSAQMASEDEDVQDAQEKLIQAFAKSIAPAEA